MILYSYSSITSIKPFVPRMSKEFHREAPRDTHERIAFTNALESILDKSFEPEFEARVLNQEVVVVNCADLGKHVGATSFMTRAGVVPLRWGAPRILLVTPSQGKLLRCRIELVRAWRLWRYEFDPHTDIVIEGSPNRAETIIRTNCKHAISKPSENHPWYDGFELGGEFPAVTR